MECGQISLLQKLQRPAQHMRFQQWQLVLIAAQLLPQFVACAASPAALMVAGAPLQILCRIICSCPGPSLRHSLRLSRAWLKGRKGAGAFDFLPQI